MLFPSQSIETAMIFFSGGRILAICRCFLKKVCHKSFMPSMNKVGKESNKGGARPGAGRPSGLTKAKTSISVDSAVLQRALAKHGGKLSSLVEKLLRVYVE